MDCTPTRVYPAVDWFSLTTGADADADLAYEKARALQIEQEADGDRIRPWGSNGYRGWGAPHVRVGAREGDVLVELSGVLADRYWAEFLPLARNVTRLDTCVTCVYPREVRDLAVSAYNAPRVQFRPGLPPIAKVLTQELTRGQTCYLGAPASKRRARLYDKHAESRGEWPENSWRWELQERGEMGSLTAGALNGVRDVRAAIRTHVRNYFTAHGIEPWFLADGGSLHAPSRRARRDLQRHLDWLRTGVAPAVRRWRNRAGRDAILDALGLADGDSE